MSQITQKQHGGIIEVQPLSLLNLWKRHCSQEVIISNPASIKFKDYQRKKTNLLEWFLTKLPKFCSEGMLEVSQCTNLVQQICCFYLKPLFSGVGGLFCWFRIIFYKGFTLNNLVTVSHTGMYEPCVSMTYWRMRQEGNEHNDISSYFWHHCTCSVTSNEVSFSHI